MTNYNINVDHSIFRDNAAVVRNDHGTAPSLDTDLLRDLADAHKALAETQPMIARSLDDLRQALEQRDEKTAGQKIKELSVGVAADVVAGVAGGALLKLLGLG